MTKHKITDHGRECTDCGILKDWSEFNLNKSDKHGHDNRCRSCLQLYRQTSNYREKNLARNQKRLQNSEERKRHNQHMQEYHSRPDILEKTRSEEWRQKNNLYRKEWRKRNPEKAKSQNRRSRIRFLNSPTHLLASQFSSLIRNSLRKNGGSKKNQSWESLVGYTAEQLKSHLENLWELGMTWKNHTSNGWHIDHIVPVSHFHYNSPSDLEFKICWSLSNLAPRWSTTTIAKKHGSNNIGNINKNNKLI